MPTTALPGQVLPAATLGETLTYESGHCHAVLNAFGGFPGALSTLIDSTAGDWGKVATLDITMLVDARGTVHGRIACPTLAADPPEVLLTPRVLSLGAIDALDCLCPACAADAIASESRSAARYADPSSLRCYAASIMTSALEAAGPFVTALAAAESHAPIEPGTEEYWYGVTAELGCSIFQGPHGIAPRADTARLGLLERLGDNGRTSGELDEWARRYHLWSSCRAGTVDRQSLGTYLTIAMDEGPDVVVPVPEHYLHRDPARILGLFDDFADQRPAQQPAPGQAEELWEHWCSLAAQRIDVRLEVVALHPGFSDLGALEYLVGSTPRAMVVDAHTAAFLAHLARSQRWFYASLAISSHHRDLANLEVIASTLVANGMALDDALTSAVAATS